MSSLSEQISAPPQVLVVGDCMLDVYLEGAVQRISPDSSSAPAGPRTWP